jgi:hypothetical protein
MKLKAREQSFRRALRDRALAKYRKSRRYDLKRRRAEIKL